MYFIVQYDTESFPIKKALGKKRIVIVQRSESALENPQNTASLRLKSRLAEKHHSDINQKQLIYASTVSSGL